MSTTFNFGADGVMTSDLVRAISLALTKAKEALDLMQLELTQRLQDLEDYDNLPFWDRFCLSFKLENWWVHPKNQLEHQVANARHNIYFQKDVLSQLNNLKNAIKFLSPDGMCLSNDDALFITHWAISN